MESWDALFKEGYDEIAYYRPLSCSIAGHVGIDVAGIGVCVINGTFL